MASQQEVLQAPVEKDTKGTLLVGKRILEEKGRTVS